MELGENKILFKPLPADEQTESGLFVPLSARAVSNKGTIEMVGYGTEKKPMRLKEGLVGFRVKDWGEELIIENERYFLMEQEAILAIE